jgi:hypothetical protein
LLVSPGKESGGCAAACRGCTGLYRNSRRRLFFEYSLRLLLLQLHGALLGFVLQVDYFIQLIQHIDEAVPLGHLFENVLHPRHDLVLPILCVGQRLGIIRLQGVERILLRGIWDFPAMCRATGRSLQSLLKSRHTMSL